MEAEKIFENGRDRAIRLVDSAVYAMQVLQSEMRGEAERTDLTSEEDVMVLVKEMRNEDKDA